MKKHSLTRTVLKSRLKKLEQQVETKKLAQQSGEYLSPSEIHNYWSDVTHHHKFRNYQIDPKEGCNYCGLIEENIIQKNLSTGEITYSDRCFWCDRVNNDLYLRAIIHGINF